MMPLCPPGGRRDSGRMDNPLRPQTFAHDARGQRQARRRLRLEAEGRQRALVDGPGTVPSAPLFTGEHGGRGYASRANSGWIRLLAWLLASHLDDRLAAGAPPETNRLTVARADRLVSLPMRVSVAQNWRDLLAQAAAPRPGRQPGRTTLPGADPGCRRRHPGHAGCADALLPVPARGVAAAKQLLTDGTGPLYNPASTTDLSAALREVVGLLDPTTALTVCL